MRVLQIGHDDWSAALTVPAGVDWMFADAREAHDLNLSTLSGRADVTLMDGPCSPSMLRSVDSLIAPYTLLVAPDLLSGADEDHRSFFTRKVATPKAMEDRQRLLDELPRRFFSQQFGQKLGIRKAQVSPAHPAQVHYEGNAYIVTQVEHDGEARQLVMWKENIAYNADRPLELWPEYLMEDNAEIELVVQLIQSGTSDVIAAHRRYTGADMAEPIVFDEATSGYLSCSIFARGNGQVKIGPIHYRRSRLGAGAFLPGGKRIADSRREELFYYFHPGDLTPPLNIYFSGYRPAEGFEGWHMMAGLGHPFLLITDPRLEGGRFYLGSDELEDQLREVISELIESLGFREEDTIFSGLSMGSFGALYYGSRFKAHAIIAGKPIINLGHVAERSRLVRPQEFLTILDLVNFWNRPDADGNPSTPEDFHRELLQRWNAEPGFGNTKILMSYMQHDDYDDQAYYTLLNSQTGKPTTVIARGYQGRHNDDSPSIVAWFVSQYRRVISEYGEART